MIQTPWAVLLCKFNDDDSEPFPQSFYEDLFTVSGAGKHNLIDYFRDVSHGTLDLTGTQVFGWFTLDKKRSDYAGSGANWAGRDDLLQWGRQTATLNGVNLAAFFNIVMCMNVPTDLYGGPNGAVCDNGADPDDGINSMSPSLVAHEMGHVYGLSHSRADGSQEDYKDPWDIMSVKSAQMTPHPVFTQRDVRGNLMFWMGPALNAANMDGRGWLDQTRVWTANPDDQVIIELRPLLRHDLPGYVAARVWQYLVEFRVPESWDAGIHRSTQLPLGHGPSSDPAVLVHGFEGNHSYIMKGVSGKPDLGPGDIFKVGDPDNPVGLAAALKVTVDEIDVANLKVTLRISTRADHRRPVGPGIVFGGATRDGGGWVIVGSRIVRIPPRSPLVRILEQVAAIAEGDQLGISSARDVIQREAFGAIAEVASGALQQLRAYREPTKVTLPSVINRTRPSTDNR